MIKLNKNVIARSFDIQYTAHMLTPANKKKTIYMQCGADSAHNRRMLEALETFGHGQTPPWSLRWGSIIPLEELRNPTGILDTTGILDRYFRYHRVRSRQSRAVCDQVGSSSRTISFSGDACVRGISGGEAIYEKQTARWMASRLLRVFRCSENLLAAFPKAGKRQRQARQTHQHEGAGLGNDREGVKIRYHCTPRSIPSHSITKELPIIGCGHKRLG